MPAAAAPGKGGIQRGLPPSKLPPLPPAPAARPARYAGVSARVQHQQAYQAPQHTTRAPIHGGSDALSSGSGYGSAQASAFKGTKAYHDAVAAVFAHQPVQQKAAIITGLIRSGAFKTPEGRAVYDVWHSLPVDEATALQHYLPHAHGINVFGALEGVLKKGAGDYGGKGNPGTGSLAYISPKGSTLSRMPLNAGKDLVNLPAETFSTVGVLGGDVLGGHPGKLVSDVLDPFVNLAEHPISSFANHPLDSYLMATGAIHGATRLAAGAVRAAAPDSALGRALNTTREGVALTGNLTHERPRYSPYPLIQGGQKLVEKTRYQRAPTGELVPRSRAVQDRLTGLGVSRIVGISERIRRANRDNAAAARGAAVRPGLAVRVGHAAKTSLKRGDQTALIPGAGVLARIADGTIRRPDTLVADLEKHLRQVSSTRAGLSDSPHLLKEHDAYVKQLQAALADKAFLRNPKAAFAAAEQYAHDYRPVEGEAHGLGQFGDASRGALMRRTVMHYAVTHMGAHHDPELGLVGARGGVLDTQTVLRHMRGADGVGRRTLAFTSDRPKMGSAFYQSSERRPLPQTARNTLFAYTHGLTDPGHEALLEQHVRMQGIVDAHKAVNRMLDAIAVQKPGGGYWSTFNDAQAEARRLGGRYRPVNLAQPFHAQGALDQAMEHTDPADLEHEAVLHSLDISSRLQPGTRGRWALADRAALRRIEEHKAQITSNPVLRAFKAANNQFRQVALGTSAKHIPGIIQEGLIRDIASGVGVSSWITGRRLLNAAERANPEKGAEARTTLTGGTVSGSTQMAITRQTSDHFAGTNLHPVLRAFEETMRTPGVRQLRGAWHAWLRFAITGTKKYIEQQNQVAGVGKAALQDFGSEHGPFLKALRLQGQMLEDAAKGIVDPAKLRQVRAEVERIYGRWTDLTPTGQTAMMFSPFGLWWVNSAKWLMRLPVDHPVKTGMLASATVGTEKQRQSQGLNIFDPGALPLYEQGGIPIGGKILAQNYYSPFGVANDPIQTATSLIGPWYSSVGLGALGLNWLGHPLESPGNPKGRTPANVAERAQYILNSALASFVPLYSKAQTIAAGGASQYDITGNSPLPGFPSTKTPGRGVVAGAEKALTPFRSYKKAAPAASSSGGSGWGSWGSSSGGSSSGGWGAWG